MPLILHRAMCSFGSLHIHNSTHSTRKVYYLAKATQAHTHTQAPMRAYAKGERHISANLFRLEATPSSKSLKRRRSAADNPLTRADQKCALRVRDGFRDFSSAPHRQPMYDPHDIGIGATDIT